MIALDRAALVERVQERFQAHWQALQAASLMRARRLIEELVNAGVRPALTAEGALMLCDETGWHDDKGRWRMRDLTRFVAVERVYSILLAGLDLDPGLIGPFETMEAPGAPPGCSSKRWRIACAGATSFIAKGYGAQASALGWTDKELFTLPLLWSRIDQCGVAWLIGRKRVAAVTAEAIAVEAPSGSQLNFYRRRR